MDSDGLLDTSHTAFSLLKHEYGGGGNWIPQPYDYYDIALTLTVDTNHNLKYCDLLAKGFHLMAYPLYYDKGKELFIPISSDVCKVHRYEFCPEQIIDQTTLNHKKSYSIAANLGGTAGGSSGATVGISFTYSNELSFERKRTDINIYPHVRDNLSSWEISFENFSTNSKLSSAYFDPNVTLKLGTFRWIWEIKRSEAQKHLYFKNTEGKERFLYKIELGAKFKQMSSQKETIFLPVFNNNGNNEPQQIISLPVPDAERDTLAGTISFKNTGTEIK
ncbi:MAG: hypothetical protein BGO77_02785 [Caedibacter sp. 37-49]|nr:MAG: hypothetical protein BGO77_02785 [Caedibacter sp. 37-49]